MLAGFRYRLGNDTINYMKWYESLYTLSNFKLDLSDYEIGFTFLSSLIKTLGGDFYVLQFVTAFIINFSILSYFKKYCRNYTFFCILIYFCMYYFEFSFEIMRASVALGIFIYAIPLLIKKKYIQFYLLSFIAFLFHYSTAFVFLLPFLMKIRLNKYIIVCIVMVLILYQSINWLFLNFFTILAFNERMAEVALFYVESETFGGAGALNINGYISSCFIPLLVILVPYIYIKYIVKEEELLKFEPFIVLNALFTVSIVGIPIFYRLTYFFVPPTIICIAVFAFKLINHIKSSINKYFLLLLFIVIPYISFIYITKYRTEMSGYSRYYMYYPYSSFFNEEIIYERETIYRREE